MVPKISSDLIIFKIRTDERGIVFTMIDYRQPLPIHCEFVVNSKEDELEFINLPGLFKIEIKLGLALANVIQYNATFN